MPRGYLEVDGWFLTGGESEMGRVLLIDYIHNIDVTFQKGSCKKGQCCWASK
jgi:hypothetical protein